MAISIICTNKDPQPWVAALHDVDASLDIQVWPNEKQKSEIEFALCWKHPEGILQNYPNLRCISSMGAGIDHFLNDSFFPEHLPVVRLVDPLLAQSMFEYICTAVMFYFREFDLYQAQQRQACWYQQPPQSMAETTIGMMGLGQLGGYAAEKFSLMGFDVVGWSRSRKSLNGIQTFAGPQEFETFLSKTKVLICLLPLTPQTQGILNRDLFYNLPKGASIVNVARGEHLVEEDLIEALDADHLRGACLDVFREEPLPRKHPFWTHKKIVVTPHCSSITNPKSVAPQIVQNYQLMQNGKPLLNRVDILRGY